MSDDNNHKCFVIISSTIPNKLAPFYDDGTMFNGRSQERVIEDFEHQVFEVPSFDDLSSIPIDESTIFLAFKRGPSKGLYNELDKYEDGEYGLISNFYILDGECRYVFQNGDYVVVPEGEREWIVQSQTFPPQKFSLKPFPIWEKPLGNDLTDSVGWND